MTTHLYEGDCLPILRKEVADQSVDMVFCDLPYGVTACKWDAVIPFSELWGEYERMVKPRGAIVLTATQPFTAMAVMSNRDWFRYEWIWDKVTPVGFQIAKFRPMQRHESVLVFSKESPNYYPLMTRREQSITATHRIPSEVSPLAHEDHKPREYFWKYPQSILTSETGGVLTLSRPNRTVHSTQKPVPLMAYFIQTYSRAGETVLDNTMGSGSTGVAAVMEGRKFIGIEKDPDYFKIAVDRVSAAKPGHHDFGVNADGSTLCRIVEENTEQLGMDFSLQASV